MAESDKPAGGAGDPTADLVEVLLGSARSYLEKNELAEAERCVDHALTMARTSGAPPVLISVLRLSGSVHVSAQHLEAAEKCWRECLELARGIGERDLIAEFLGELGKALRGLGRYDEACETLRESLQLSSGDVPGARRAQALEELGKTYRLLGRIDSAIDSLSEALRIRDALGDKDGIAQAERALGNALVESGRYSEAGDRYRHAHQLFEELGSVGDSASTLNNLGSVHLQLGENSDAEQNFLRAREMFVKIGNENMVAYAANNLGVLATYRGDAAAAERYLNESLELRQKIGSKKGQTMALSNLAHVAHISGRYVESIERADRAIQLLGEVGQVQGVSAAWFNRGRSALELGRFDEVERAVHEIEQLHAKTEAADAECEALLLAAEMHLRRDDQKGALEAASRARELGVQSDLARHEAEGLRLAGEAYLALGDDASARESLSAGERAFRDLQSPYHLARCRLTLGRLFLGAGAPEAAAERLRRAAEAFQRMGNSMLRWRALLALAESEWPLARRQARSTLAQAMDLARTMNRPDLLQEAEGLGEELSSGSSAGSLNTSQFETLVSIGRVVRGIVEPETAARLALQTAVDELEFESGWLQLGRHLETSTVLAYPLGIAFPERLDELMSRIGESGHAETVWSEGDGGSGERSYLVGIPILSAEGTQSAYFFVGGSEAQTGATGGASTPVLLPVMEAVGLLLGFILEVRQGEKLQPSAAEPDHDETFHGIVGSSPALRAIFRTIEKIAGSDSSVLIQGESGTGKELVARAIHDRSGRASGAFEAISCPSIPRDLIEAELFGHEKGAFTGADRARPGRFELAQGGTLFLDEVGDMDMATQSKLLRFLQEREFHRVGGRKPIRVDVRLVAATSRNLEEEISAGRFREDLYYRLSVVPIAMPPLRERGEDIDRLCGYYLDEFSSRKGLDPIQIAEDAQDLLRRYPWPGNVRELRNLLEYLVALSPGDLITIKQIPEKVRQAAEEAPIRGHDGGVDAILRPGETLDARLMSIEGQLIRQALARCDGNQSQAARILGITETKMRHRMRRYGVPQEGSKRGGRRRPSSQPPFSSG